MAAIDVTVTGVLYDKLSRTTQQVVLIGEASLTGLSVGGGPVEPPDKPPVLPPDVEVPPPGSPPVLVPGGTPTHPIVAPPFIVVDYPGMGKVIVPQPVPA